MRKLLNIILLTIISGTVALGQGKLVRSEDSFLIQLQERDSVLIGDQLRYGFHIKNLPVGVGVMLPDFSQGFMPGDSVEIVRSWEMDTLKTYGPKKSPKSRDIDFSVVITSFEEGKYLLPPLSIVSESAPGSLDTIVFKPLELEVFTIPIETTTFEVHDIKGQIKYPVTFSEVLPYLFVVLAIVLLAFLIRALIIGITDTLREYIDARYGIDAPEMTTAEIFDNLGHTDVPADLFVQTKELFETADMVKFAKAFATDEENAAAVPLAVRFVTSTYQVSPVPEPVEGPVVRQAHQPDNKEGGTE